MEKLNQTIKNLNANGFATIHVKTKEEALKEAKKFIKENETVGLGGSESVNEIGLLAHVVELEKQGKITLHNQYEPNITMEQNIHRRRMGLVSDLYITSTNALTCNGELVNVDGSGNRVAAQIFGPKKVLIIASTNKIVPDLEAGYKRIEKIAAAKNLQRINQKAKKYDKPLYTMASISQKFAHITRDIEGRTTIVLVEEELGF